ncbi:MAG: hypothetical protein AAF108_02750 [Planctomycetota bacterium]
MWEAAGRRLPDPNEFRPARSPRAVAASAGEAHAAGLTVAELIRDYWRYARNEQGQKRLSNIKVTLRLLRSHFGTEPAATFGPRRLRQLRDAMIAGDPTPSDDGRPSRRPWSRRTCNDRVGIVVGIFRWAAAQELVPPGVPQGLAMLAPLKRGRTAAREGRRIAPAETEYRAWFDDVQRTGAQWKASIDRGGEIRGLLGQLTLTALDDIGPSLAGVPIAGPALPALTGLAGLFIGAGRLRKEKEASFNKGLEKGAANTLPTPSWGYEVRT